MVGIKRRREGKDRGFRSKFYIAGHALAARSVLYARRLFFDTKHRKPFLNGLIGFALACMGHLFFS
jgi:hypothetical protein